MTDKPFKTIDEQLNILKSRGLVIINDSAAKQSLQNNGYYEIINGYKYPFLLNPSNDEEGYNPSASFENIYEFYQLDSYIRSAVIDSIEIFENSFKQAVAYAIAENISEELAEYSNSDNYVPGHINNHGNSDRDFLLRRINTVSGLNTEPYKHYRETHDNIPPWILVKGLSLGNTIYLFRLLKDSSIKEKIIGRMMGFDPAIIPGIDAQFRIKQVFSDSLSLILDYRNLAAHGGRIYDHRSVKHQISVYSPLLYNNSYNTTSRTEFKNGKNRSSINALLLCFFAMGNDDPYINLKTWLTTRLRMYNGKYPSDMDFIINKTEFIPNLGD